MTLHSHPTPLPDVAPVAQANVRADRDGLAHCLNLTQSVCNRLGLADEDAMALRLAVEEACTNITDHGYPADHPGPLTLEFRVLSPDCVEARMCDRATPFHPDEAREPDLDAGLDDRPIGGLGWFFIKQVMTEVDYHSDAQGNCLRLRRHLTRPCTAG
jgi:anti-sigma regulatory factor (Ser/Thr protein kinase)